MECCVLIYWATWLFIWLCYLEQFTYPLRTSEKSWGKRFGERKEPLKETIWNISGEKPEDLIVQKDLGSSCPPLTIWMGKLKPRQPFGLTSRVWSVRLGSSICRGKRGLTSPAAGEIKDVAEVTPPPSTPNRSCGFYPCSQEQTAIFTSTCDLQHPSSALQTGHHTPFSHTCTHLIHPVIRYLGPSGKQKSLTWLPS